MKSARFLPRSARLREIVAILITTTILIPVIWVGTSLLKDYGWTLFVIVPYFMGFLPGLITGIVGPRTPGRMILTGLIGLIFMALILLLLAFEGAICLVMAAPLAAPLVVTGAVSAYAVLRFFDGPGRPGRLYCCAVLALPLCLGVEHWQRPTPPLLRVQSSVEIQATPEVVWRHVVTFSELPPTKEWLFHSGIAYPLRAEIQGQGRGAVRYCVFSTGPFVEPIEVWNEPRLLKFSVAQNPPPMRELSPYSNLHPPHLDGFFISEQGQFLLIPLEGGGTRLEGTTWYHHGLWPAAYWQLWSDYIIHRIHLRVLNHVKELSEQDANDL